MTENVMGNERKNDIEIVIKDVIRKHKEKEGLK